MKKDRCGIALQAAHEEADKRPAAVAAVAGLAAAAAAVAAAGAAACFWPLVFLLGLRALAQQAEERRWCCSPMSLVCRVGLPAAAAAAAAAAARGCAAAASRTININSCT